MNFLNPAFLWALLALAIPIIVHLFNFRRARKIYFSNVSFLENVKESSSSKLKLKHLLILASRLLVVFFLVMAFAQPFFPGKEQGLNSDLVKIYLDNSQSSSNLNAQDQTGLSDAIALAESIVELYPAETQFQLVTNNFGALSNNPKSKSKVLELTTELDYSNLARNRDEVINRLDVGNNSSTSQDIYIISDFQKSTFGSNRQFFSDSVNQYKVLPIEFASYDNVFIDSIYLESPFLISGETNKLHIRLKNVGSRDLSDIVLKLFVNELQAGSVGVDIEKNGVGKIIFDLNFGLEQINSCRLAFEDFPLTFDNEYFFVLNLLKKINIAEIRHGDLRTYVEKVYSNNSLFNFRSYPKGQIDYGAVQSSDLLILNQLETIDKSIINLANDFLNKNKTVMLVPGERADIDAITELLRSSFAATDQINKLKLENPDVKNPFFDNIFTQIDSKTEMPEARISYAWNKSGINLLKGKNGLPFLTRFQRPGSLFLFASPFHEDFTNFHNHALVVPVMYKIAALSSNSYYPLSYSIDQPSITVKLDSIPTESLYKLANKDEEYILQQRINDNNLILDIPKFLLKPGFYNLTYDDQIINKLAFNHSKLESNPISLTEEEIGRVFSSFQNMEIIYSTDAQSFSESMKERYEGVQLWKYALVLSLIFLLTETLFLRFL